MQRKPGQGLYEAVPNVLRSLDRYAEMATCALMTSCILIDIR
jgi:hypothetical protein